MYNNRKDNQMDNLKVEIIKKLLMLDTKEELIKIKLDVSDAISRECDADDQDQVEFKKWKAKKESEKQDEITF
jgi:hypothetical protein